MRTEVYKNGLFKEIISESLFEGESQGTIGKNTYKTISTKKQSKANYKIESV